MILRAPSDRWSCGPEVRDYTDCSSKKSASSVSGLSPPSVDTIPYPVDRGGTPLPSGGSRAAPPALGSASTDHGKRFLGLTVR
ncbi:MAG: hypothetical protein LBU25_09070 [Treponema sp.]|nr:hypothetical protein [Treponema sp.]